MLTTKMKHRTENSVARKDFMIYVYTNTDLLFLQVRKNLKRINEQKSEYFVCTAKQTFFSISATKENCNLCVLVPSVPLIFAALMNHDSTRWTNTVRKSIVYCFDCDCVGEVFVVDLTSDSILRKSFFSAKQRSRNKVPNDE